MLENARKCSKMLENKLVQKPHEFWISTAYFRASTVVTDLIRYHQQFIWWTLFELKCWKILGLISDQYCHYVVKRSFVLLRILLICKNFLLRMGTESFLWEKSVRKVTPLYGKVKTGKTRLDQLFSTWSAN